MAACLRLDLAAQRTQPPADVSAMDGYAVRAADVKSAPARLRLIGEVAAGHPFEGTVGAGEAARIFTGGVVPPGADTIVIQENTTRENTTRENTARDVDVVLINQTSGAGRHIRRAGSTSHPAPYCSPKPAPQRSRSRARRRNEPCVAHGLSQPKLAVLATGDELVLPGRSPASARSSIPTATHHGARAPRRLRRRRPRIAPTGCRRRSRRSGARAMERPIFWSLRWRLGRRLRPGAESARGRGLRLSFGRSRCGRRR